MSETLQKPAEKTADPLKGLHPGRQVFYWETAMNVGLRPCPSIVITVARDGERKRTGEVMLHVFYHDGDDGVKRSVFHADKPEQSRWTWPMNSDGSPLTE